MRSLVIFLVGSLLVSSAVDAMKIDRNMKAVDANKKLACSQSIQLLDIASDVKERVCNVDAQSRMDSTDSIASKMIRDADRSIPCSGRVVKETEQISMSQFVSAQLEVERVFGKSPSSGQCFDQTPFNKGSLCGLKVISRCACLKLSPYRNDEAVSAALDNAFYAAEYAFADGAIEKFQENNKDLLLRLKQLQGFGGSVCNLSDAQGSSCSATFLSAIRINKNFKTKNEEEIKKVIDFLTSTDKTIPVSSALDGLAEEFDRVKIDHSDKAAVKIFLDKFVADRTRRDCLEIQNKFQTICNEYQDKTYEQIKSEVTREGKRLVQERLEKRKEFDSISSQMTPSIDQEVLQRRVHFKSYVRNQQSTGVAAVPLILSGLMKSDPLQIVQRASPEIGMNVESEALNNYHCEQIRSLLQNSFNPFDPITSRVMKVKRCITSASNSSECKEEINKLFEIDKCSDQEQAEFNNNFEETLEMLEFLLHPSLNRTALVKDIENDRYSPRNGFGIQENSNDSKAIMGETSPKITYVGKMTGQDDKEQKTEAVSSDQKSIDAKDKKGVIEPITTEVNAETALPPTATTQQVARFDTINQEATRVSQLEAVNESNIAAVTKAVESPAPETSAAELTALKNQLAQLNQGRAEITAMRKQLEEAKSKLAAEVSGDSVGEESADGLDTPKRLQKYKLVAKGKPSPSAVNDGAKEQEIKNETTPVASKDIPVAAPPTQAAQIGGGNNPTVATTIVGNIATVGSSVKDISGGTSGTTAANQTIDSLNGALLSLNEVKTVSKNEIESQRFTSSSPIITDGERVFRKVKPGEVGIYDGGYEEITDPKEKAKYLKSVKKLPPALPAKALIKKVEDDNASYKRLKATIKQALGL